MTERIRRFRRRVCKWAVVDAFPYRPGIESRRKRCAAREAHATAAPRPIEKFRRRCALHHWSIAGSCLLPTMHVGRSEMADWQSTSTGRWDMLNLLVDCRRTHLHPDLFHAQRNFSTSLHISAVRMHGRYECRM